MKPKYYFTLDGDMGPYAISEPEGWANIIFNIERDLTYWSLVENFEVPLTFYGIAEGMDGGYNYISNARDNGINTKVTLDIDVSFDGGITIENCFDGRIDLSTAKETIYRAKIEAAVVRNDLWSVFMAKKSTPVDLLSTTDVYGNARIAINKQELFLPSQRIRSFYKGRHSAMQLNHVLADSTQIEFTNVAPGNFCQLDFEFTDISEVTEKFTIPAEYTGGTFANPLFGLQYGGDVTFTDVQIILNGFTFTYKNWANIDVYIQVGETGTPQIFTRTDAGTDGVDGKTYYNYSGTLTAKPHDNIRLYVKNNSVSTRTFFWFDYEDPTFLTSPALDSHLYMYQDSYYQDSQCDSVLLHDAGLSICDRILGKDDSFYSLFLGGQYSSIAYASNGCGYLNALTRGLNLRGYLFSEKPFTVSFDDWWNGANPVFSLGLGYEELIPGDMTSTVIRIENKSYFFDSEPSIYLTAINDITVEFDLNMFTKTVEIGFEQWAAESASGIDDPQTKHTYSLPYGLFGKDEKQLSKFIAASLAIEQGRRLVKSQNADWRLDENIFIVALQEQDPTGDSPAFITQQPEVFTSGITGLNNPNTRINVRHTPARILDRWIDWYSGQMQNYTANSFIYQSGEGNVDMSWGGNGCDDKSLIENQNQNVSSDFVFVPVVYSFIHPLSWNDYKTIRDNRKNAISISWIDPHGITQVKTAFIKKLGFEINKSRGTFEVWIKDSWFSFDGLAFSDAFEI